MSARYIYSLAVADGSGNVSATSRSRLVKTCDRGDDFTSEHFEVKYHENN